MSRILPVIFVIWESSGPRALYSTDLQHTSNTTTKYADGKKHLDLSLSTILSIIYILIFSWWFSAVADEKTHIFLHHHRWDCSTVLVFFFIKKKQ